MTGAATIELYVGNAIEHASERDVLAALVEHLTRIGGWALIFANIHLGGRQIDFLVATDWLTPVIEAKHFSRSVRGQVRRRCWRRMSGTQPTKKRTYLD